MTPRFSRATIACAVYAALHLAAQLSARYFQVSDGISLWYPPCGLALALLVLLGPRAASTVFLVNFVTAVLTSVASAKPYHAPWWTLIAYPGLITANYTLVAIAARRWLGPKLLPGNTRETLLFALVMIAAPMGIAFAGTAINHATSAGTPPLYFEAVVKWWVGDLSGLLTVVPVAMVFAGPWVLGPGDRERWDAPRGRVLVDALVQAAALAAVLWAVFTVEPLPQYDAFYLCFLPLIWICLRHGLPGATLAALAIVMGSLIGMHVAGSSTSRIVNFLLFEITVTVVGLGLGSAVSRRDAAEARVTASERQLDRVIAGAQLGLWDWNVADGTIAHNRRCAAMLDVALEDIGPAEAKWQARLHPSDRGAVGAAMRAHLDGDSPLFEAEYRVAAADGSWRWFHSRGSVVARDRAGKPRLVSGTHLDVTDRKRAESEVHRLLEIVEATTDLVLTTDREGRVLYVNSALLRALDCTTPLRLRGRPFTELLPPSATAVLQTEIIPTALAMGAWNGEIAVNVPGGRELPVSLVAVAHRDTSGEGTTLSFVMRDVSRQKQAEAEKLEHERHLQQMQKAESLGILAGGIAHDFNNLLTTVLGNANLARMDLADGSPLHVPLDHIERASHRAAALCQQMLAYAGRSTLVFSELDLNALIEETRQLLQVSIPKKVTFDLVLARPLARVRAAAPQLQQVVMNLALNAAEAIGDGEGAIRIRTGSRAFGPAELRDQFEAPALPAGDYVLLEVEDTGRGMAPDVRARIFEPFFTTKFTGHGLGLSAVLGIVKSHRGTVHVVSAPGRGSTFRVLLPALPAGGTIPSPRPPAAPGAPWRGSGLVLVVDDEIGVRDVIAQMVTSFGFQTIVGADGVEAVELFKRHRERLRLVLLDLTMPRLDGEEAFNQLHALGSGVPVILMSGYSEKLTYERFAHPRPAGFLAKPFSLQSLQALLESVFVPAK